MSGLTDRLAFHEEINRFLSLRRAPRSPQGSAPVGNDSMIRTFWLVELLTDGF